MDGKVVRGKVRLPASIARIVEFPGVLVMFAFWPGQIREKARLQGCRAGGFDFHRSKQ